MTAPAPPGTPPSGTPPSGTPPSGTPPSGTPPSGTPPSGTPSSGSPATSPAAASPRRSFPGLVRALLPCLVLALIAVWLSQPDGDQVRVVDPGPDLAYAQRVAPYRVLAPAGLPSGWRPTSSRVADAPVRLEIGYLTPAGRFARLIETGDPVDAVLGAERPGASRAGQVRAGGAEWARYQVPDGEIALIRRAGAATVLVTGSAGAAELTELAGSVR